jgi:hypothetical protein
MNEPTLGIRMEKLEGRFEVMQSDMSEVKIGVKRLTDALTGDGINPGKLHDLNVRIDSNKTDIHEVRTHIQSIESRMLTSDHTKKVAKYIGIIEGWQGILISIGAMTAFAYTVIQIISKLQ